MFYSLTIAFVLIQYQPLFLFQAEVYKEDFLEERKARARAHSKLEELKAELKREKKSRARLMTMLQQQNQTSEKSTPLVG